MGILDQLAARNEGNDAPFLITPTDRLTFSEIAAAARQSETLLSPVKPGDIVAIIGDFDRSSIATMLQLVDRNAIVVPLTDGTRPDHDYFLESAAAEWVFRDGALERIERKYAANPLITQLRNRQHPGVIFFSSGTTGRPKAILHDFQNFSARYTEVRPALRTLNFLLFDHAGGINTMLHTLFNRGVTIAPPDRTPDSIVETIRRENIELLPTTPTFLRMMLLGGSFDDGSLPSLRVITYGTERMDQGTLDRLSQLLPNVGFRQTYGLSELGVFQVKSKARDSLWMKIGGAGLETRIVDNVLQIRSANRMLGYLNAPSPFVDGWYSTGDIVEEQDGFIKIVGRASEVFNIGGLKILPGEVERIALTYPGVLRAKAYGVANPITGQHIEIICEPESGASLDRRSLMTHFRSHLQKQLCPHKIIVGVVPVSHRFKQQ
ncbi:MAG: long-chain fatty acid--CoA ligase [Gemmatimonadaceae bacterium]